MDSIEYLNPENLNGLNLFACCGNNPVMYVDPSGHILLFLACLSGIVLSGLITGLSAAAGKQDDESFLGAFLGGFIDGAIGVVAVAVGLFITGPAGVLIAVVIGAVGGIIGNYVS